MADVCISYASEDKRIAEALCGFLREKGIKVWWDGDLPQGPYHESLMEEIKIAQGVIPLWSQHSLKQGCIQTDEVRFAVDNKKALFPVRLDNSPVPIPFGMHTPSS